MVEALRPMSATTLWRHRQIDALDKGGGHWAEVASSRRQVGQSAGVLGLRSRSLRVVSLAISRCGCGQCQTRQSKRMFSTRLNQHQSTSIVFFITREREKAGASRKDSEARPGRQVARRCSMELSTSNRGRTGLWGCIIEQCYSIFGPPELLMQTPFVLY